MDKPDRLSHLHVIGNEHDDKAKHKMTTRNDIAYNARDGFTWAEPARYQAELDRADGSKEFKLLVTDSDRKALQKAMSHWGLDTRKGLEIDYVCGWAHPKDSNAPGWFFLSVNPVDVLKPSARQV